MPRLDADTWMQIKAEYWAGATLERLAEKYNVAASSISRQKTAHKWERDNSVELAIAIQARENANAKQMQEAQNSAISDRADVIVETKRKHIGDWQDVRSEAQTAADLDAVRLAKMKAETLEIIQKGERRALGIDRLEAQSAAAPPVDDAASAQSRAIIALLIDRLRGTTRPEPLVIDQMGRSSVPHAQPHPRSAPSVDDTGEIDWGG